MIGPRIVIIMAILMSISGLSFANNQTVHTCLESWLSNQFPVKNGHWKVSQLSSNKPLEMLKVTSCRVTGVVGSKKPKKIMIFKVVPKVGNTVYHRQVTARVIKYIKVPVANHVIRKGVTLNRSQWRLEERRSAFLSRDAIREISALKDKRSKKVISINEVITRHAVEPIPDIVLGKEITLRVIGPGVVLSTDAISMEEGNIQDWIEFKQRSTGKVVKAKIIGPGEAVIQLARRK